MLVYLCWANTRSNQVAKIFKCWMPKIIQAVDPWISNNIQKGARWSTEIAKILEQCRIGIVCLTKENLNENWILFEAGALAKTKDAIVCTFLLDLKPSEVEQPLSQFQHTEFEKEEIRKLIYSINSRVAEVGEKSLNKEMLDEIFEKFWPELEKELNNVKNNPSVKPTARDQKDMVEEILEIVRGLALNKPYNNLDIATNRMGIPTVKIIDKDSFTQVANSTHSNQTSIEGGPKVCGFYGDVSIDRVGVKQSTPIEVWMQESPSTKVKIGKVITTDSKYSIFIAGDYYGKRILFTIGDSKLEALEHSNWLAGENIKVNLNANSNANCN